MSDAESVKERKWCKLNVRILLVEDLLPQIFVMYVVFIYYGKHSQSKLYN